MDGRIEEGLRTFEEAVRQRPGYVQAHDRGVGLNLLGRRAEALAAFERVLELHPLEAFDTAIADGLDDRLSHLNRAAALNALGRPGEADAARKLAEERGA